MATGNITRLEGVWPETHERAVRDSAGVTLETKLGNINTNISQLRPKVDDSVEHNRNLADSAIRDDGHYINTNTQVAAESGNLMIIFPCEPSKTYTISKIKTSRFRVAYFSEYPSTSKTGAGAITNAAATHITITTAANSQYIAAWVYNSTGETVTKDAVMESLQIELGEEATAYIAPGWTAKDNIARTKIEKMGPVVEKAKEILPLEFGVAEADTTPNYYRNVDGTLSSLNNYFYSKPYFMHKGDTIVTDSAIPTSENVSYITKVDSQNNYIATLWGGTGNDETINYTLLEDCYISISAYNTRRENFVLSQKGISFRVDALAAEVAAVAPDGATRLPSIADNNPLAAIRRDAGYGCILHKWGIIGDSLSSGEMQCFDNTSASPTDYKFLDMYKYSYGQVFARLIGAEAYNYSNGGQTTWGWLKNQGTVHDETYVGGVGGGDWRLASTPGEEKDAYIIYLGVNDKVKIENQDYELGSTSQITEYDGTDSDIDDTTTYPKSFVRYYAGIIQRILSIQPKAKIFCVTPIGENYTSIASAVRDIVEYFDSNVYLIDAATYLPAGYRVQGFALNGHLSPMGYAYWGYMINTYIDWIIRKNASDFRDTALIGTNYRPDYS